MKKNYNLTEQNVSDILDRVKDKVYSLLSKKGHYDLASSVSQAAVDCVNHAINKHGTDVDRPFSAVTYNVYSEGESGYSHWARGLNMIISKDGQKINLNEDEIKKLVNALPKTVGGKYK
jgi:hypothetical protein